jgi:hypothetical protein
MGEGRRVCGTGGRWERERRKGKGGNIEYDM